MRPGPHAGTMATLTKGVFPRLPALRMTPNSPLLRIRRSLPKRASPWDTLSLSVSAGSSGMFLGRETLPSLGTAPLDHESAAPRSHADEEAVSPSSAAIVGLERSLHCFWNPLRKVEPVMLSVNGLGVKMLSLSAPGEGVGRVIVGVLSEQTSCPTPARLRGSLLVDPVNPLSDDALGF